MSKWLSALRSEKALNLQNSCTLSTLSGALSDVCEKTYDLIVNINVEDKPINIDIDRYVGIYERRLNDLKKVCVVNPNFNGHQHRYVALTDTYLTLLKDYDLTYKSPQGYRALIALYERIGYFPFK